MKSPCVGICEYAEVTKDNVEKICKGCARTAEEIEEWFHASASRKEEILKSSRERKFEEEYKKDLTVTIRTAKILNS